MRGWTARCLLLLVLAGTMVPVALAVSAPMRHDCCQPQPESHCHMGMKMTAPGASVSSADCCGNHECCRSFVTVQQAHPATTEFAAWRESSRRAVADQFESCQSADTASHRPARAPPSLQVISL